MLSVIIPTVNEWPQIIWTIRSVAEELRDRVDFEIIVVDNVPKNMTPDKTSAHLKNVRHPWFKYVKYDEKLSHWQAKNKAVEKARGKYLFFCDAHCSIARDALMEMYFYYLRYEDQLNGSIHLPLTYQILEGRKLIYKMTCDPDKGFYHYSFSSYGCSDLQEAFKVPAMSTCGMLISRNLFDEIRGFPKELGIYGGGENFLNYTLAVLGKNKWVKAGEPIFHHGDKRAYAWNYDDHLRNKAIAHYMFGGEKLLKRFLTHSNGRPEVKEKFRTNIITTCKDHRDLIKSKQVHEIEDWYKNERRIKCLEKTR